MFAIFKTANFSFIESFKLFIEWYIKLFIFSATHSRHTKIKKTLEIKKTNPTVKVENNKYIVGPYKIKQNINCEYTYNVTFTDEKLEKIKGPILQEIRGKMNNKYYNLVFSQSNHWIFLWCNPWWEQSCQQC